MSRLTTDGTSDKNLIVNINKSNTTVVEFKKPISSPIKRKPKILTEEKYIEEISKIIQRDFFPDLEKLRAQNDYLDALDKNDFAQMEAIRAKYSGRKPTERDTSMTPATFETPITEYNGTPRSKKSETFAAGRSQFSSLHSLTESTIEGTKKSLSEGHSLDSFFQAYTSEDNYSFQEIIETADQKLRQKFSVLYNEEVLSADNLKRALKLPSIDNQFNEPDPQRKIETWTYKNMNSIMYIPNGVGLTTSERMNAVCHKQGIQYNATRLSSNPFGECSTTIEKQEPNVCKQSGSKQHEEELLANKSVQIRGFDLIKTPSPRPGEAFSPLMTWGEIEGTPFRLDGSDTPVRSNAGPSFKITENSRRENIALALAEKVGDKIRAQKQRAKEAACKNVGTPFMLSPAARRLATAKLGLRTPLLTPSPSRSFGLRKKTPSSSTICLSKSSVTSNKKKKLLSPLTSETSNTDKSSLTDDLLQIPTKRLKASDFF